MTINSTIFSFVTVNHAQDLMCLKFEALLMNKLHPSVQRYKGVYRGVQECKGGVKVCTKGSY